MFKTFVVAAVVLFSAAEDSPAQLFVRPMPRPRSNSLADRADAVEFAFGLTPPPRTPIEPGSAWDYEAPRRGYTPRGRTRIAEPVDDFFNTTDYVSPLRRPPAAFPPSGPVRMLRGPHGEFLPEYAVPRGRRSSYRFAGWQ